MKAPWPSHGVLCGPAASINRRPPPRTDTGTPHAPAAGPTAAPAALATPATVFTAGCAHVYRYKPHTWASAGGGFRCGSMRGAVSCCAGRMGCSEGHSTSTEDADYTQDARAQCHCCAAHSTSQRTNSCTRAVYRAGTRAARGTSTRAPQQHRHTDTLSCLTEGDFTCSNGLRHCPQAAPHSSHLPASTVVLQRLWQGVLLVGAAGSCCCSRGSP